MHPRWSRADSQPHARKIIPQVTAIPGYQTEMATKRQNLQTAALSTNFSEGSCGTEHWSNDAENSALHHKNILYFKIYLIENGYFKHS